MLYYDEKGISIVQEQCIWADSEREDFVSAETSLARQKLCRDFLVQRRMSYIQKRRIFTSIRPENDFKHAASSASATL